MVLVVVVLVSVLLGYSAYALFTAKDSRTAVYAGISAAVCLVVLLPGALLLAALTD